MNPEFKRKVQVTEEKQEKNISPMLTGHDRRLL